MKTIRVKTKYTFLDSVRIIGSDIVGIVTSITIHPSHHSYEVLRASGEYHTFLEHELLPVDKQATSMGLKRGKTILPKSKQVKNSSL